MRHERVPEGDFDMSATIVQTQALVPTRGRKLRNTLAVAAGALALAVGGAAQAAPHGGFHGGGWHGGYHGGYYRGGWGFDPFWGFGVGLGLAALASPVYYDSPYYYAAPPVYYPPTTTYVTPAPVYVQPSTSVPAAQSAAPEPIFYPRSGQNAAQVEADRRACNSWATTQHNAMNDASVFQRATLACMDGRGYTAR
jgi:hypothetical protein